MGGSLINGQMTLDMFLTPERAKATATKHTCSNCDNYCEVYRAHYRACFSCGSPLKGAATKPSNTCDYWIKAEDNDYE